MLRSIKITNFYSIGKEQKLSFEINSKDALDDSARHHKSGCYLNTVACVIGSNASGKTNVLRSLSFLSWFIEKSYSSLKIDKPIPLEAHKLHLKEATSFEIEFYEDDILYRYYIKLNQKQVLEERLDKKVRRINKTPIFKLIRNAKKSEITAYSLPKRLNENDWERIKERSNISLLSALIDLGYLSEITFFKKIKTNVTRIGHMRTHNLQEAFEVSQVLYNDKKLQKDVLSFSKIIDLGISDFNFKEIPLRNIKNPDEEKKAQLLECIHSSKNDNFGLPIYDESNGTQRSYSILSDALRALRTGGLLVLDEIDDGLHPDVIKRIISLFENKETNPHSVQLIFSTHQHLLLNDRTKTQIFLTDKPNDTFETEIYRLDDIARVRNDENYFHKYLTGVYGSTPNIKWI